ncbi:hypothetical protein NP233_g13014 [Leucocoprinus birnbaumii]|uniref:Uncharacterized protein n=1 Tax=Leucocoprinus birnbaumii TaxID=56174 RepID=A0AAD5VDG0_9AGAR|nr:hypothetical protein NP233_g13014 [Leucocoprinus birnbaumii]
MDRLFQWSWSIIKRRPSQVATDLMSSVDNRWEEVERLPSLSIQLKQAPLTRELEQKWLQKIQSSNRAESRDAFEAAPNAAERSQSLRLFHGKVYRAYFKTLGETDIASPVKMGSADARVPPVAHRLTTCGHFDSIRASELEEHPARANHTNCVDGWNKWWNENLQNVNPIIPYDPIDLIEAMRNKLASTCPSNVQLSRLEISSYGSFKHTPAPCCAPSILEQLNAMRKHLIETLTDHFISPTWQD